MSVQAPGVVTPLPAPFVSASAPTAPPGAHPLPHDVAAPRWRGLRGLVVLLSVLLVIAGAVAVLMVVAFAEHLGVLDDLEGSTVGRVGVARLRDADDLVRSAGLAWLVTTLAIAAPLIVWTWRAAKNAAALGRDRPRLGPEWAIAGWLIPLANLVLPALVVQDLWRGSTARIPRGDLRWRIAARSALVGWWWAAWIMSLGGALRAVGDTAADEEVSAVRTTDTFGILCALAGVAAAVLAVLVLRTITRRQERTLATQQSVWTGAHGE